MILPANTAPAHVPSGSTAPEPPAGPTTERRIDGDERTGASVAEQTERLLVRRHLETEAQELAMDRVRKAFDLQEQQRAELLREWNAMRDLAMEQMKHDDEILKKWIALI